MSDITAAALNTPRSLLQLQRHLTDNLAYRYYNHGVLYETPIRRAIGVGPDPESHKRRSIHPQLVLQAFLQARLVHLRKVSPVVP